MDKNAVIVLIALAILSISTTFKGNIKDDKNQSHSKKTFKTEATIKENTEFPEIIDIELISDHMTNKKSSSLNKGNKSL